MKGFELSNSRSLWRNPWFLWAGTLMIAVTFGVGAALQGIYATVSAPDLPSVPEPERIATLGLMDRNGALRPVPIEFVDHLNATAATLTGAASFTSARPWVTLAATTEQLDVEIVAGQYFETLGVRAALGRTLTAADSPAAAARTIVLSHSAWQRLFDGDSSAVGASVQINDANFQIVGIAAPGFPGLFPQTPTDAWVPQAAYLTTLMPATDVVMRRMALRSLVRLSPGASVELAATEVEQLRQAYRDDAAESLTASILPGIVFNASRVEADRRMSGIWMTLSLALAVAVVLNLAGLLLVRLTERESEFSIRRAIGATPGRLAAMIRIELAIVVALGVGLAALVGYWTRTMLPTWGVFVGSPTLAAWTPSLREAGFLLFAGIATWAFLSIVASLVIAARSDAATTGAPRVRQFSVLRLLCTGQFALAIPVVVAAAITASHFGAILKAGPGFRTEAVHIAQPSFEGRNVGGVHFSEVFARLFEDRLFDALAEAGLNRTRFASTTLLPLDSNPATGLVSPAADSSNPTFVLTGAVEAGYFQILGMQMIAGGVHEWGAGDGAVINEGLARRLWGEPSRAIGQMIRAQSALDGRNVERLISVQGVVSDAGMGMPGQSTPAVVYRPFTYASFAPLLIQTDDDPIRVLEAVNLAVKDIYPGLHVSRLTPLVERYDLALHPWRVRLGVVMAGSILLLLLAGAGAFVVTRMIVHRRLKEIAIRMAVGATRLQASRVVAVIALAMAGYAVLISAVTAPWWLPETSLAMTNHWSAETYLWLGVGALFALVAALSASSGAVRKILAIHPGDLLRAE